MCANCSIKSIISKHVSSSDHAREYADYYWRTHRQVGAELCDVLAIALLSRPQLVKLVDAHVEISTNGITEGTLSSRPHGPIP